MKGCIIVNAYVKTDFELNQAFRLKEEFEKLGVCIEILHTDEVCVNIDGTNATINCNVDFVIYLDKDKHILQLLEKCNIPVFNNAKAIEICDDKLMTHIALANKNIPMPKTIGGVLCYYPNAQYSQIILDKVEQTFGYPLVAKECFGSWGKNVFLIENRLQLKEFATATKLKPHLFQEYIASSEGKDIRVIVIGGKAIGAMLRQNSTDFRSNIEMGGVGKPIQLNKEYAILCENVANILGLDYCGIDLLLDKNNSPLVCEVNSNAFFRTFEKVTGINVAKLYAQFIINKMKTININ